MGVSSLFSGELTETEAEVAAVTPDNIINQNSLLASKDINVIRVAVCDLSPTIKHGLRQILGSDSSIAIVQEFATLAELFNHTEPLDIDVVVLDIEDQNVDGFDYIKNLRKTMPQTKIMIFTNCQDNARIIGSVEAGVDAFHCKQDAEAGEIINAVRTVHKGGRDLAPCVIEALLSHMQAEQLKSQARLSNREQEVLDLIATGKTNTDIADNLYISVRTVKFHVSSILSKLKVKNRTETPDVLNRYVKKSWMF